jgi:hypothetical protein
MTEQFVVITYKFAYKKVFSDKEFWMFVFLFELGCLKSKTIIYILHIMRTVFVFFKILFRFRFQKNLFDSDSCTKNFIRYQFRFQKKIGQSLKFLWKFNNWLFSNIFWGCFCKTFIVRNNKLSVQKLDMLTLRSIMAWST